MLDPAPRDILVLQYLYNVPQHGTVETAEQFGLSLKQVDLILHFNALNMASLCIKYPIAYVKNVCARKYGLSPDCIESLIRQATAPYEDHSEE